MRNHHSSTEIYEYMDCLCKEALKSCTLYNGNFEIQPNPYYNLDYLYVFINFLTYFPLWTSLIPPVDDKFANCFALQEISTTHISSYREYFMKNEWYNNKSMSVDVFIVNHTKFIKELSQKARDNIIIKKTSTKKNELIEKKNFSFLNEKENWMGKGEINEGNEDVEEELFSLKEYSKYEHNLKTIFLLISKIIIISGKTEAEIQQDVVRIHMEHSYNNTRCGEVNNSLVIASNALKIDATIDAGNFSLDSASITCSFFSNFKCQ